MADFCYSDADVGPTTASGSFGAMGVVLAPRSARSLSAIANRNTDGLITHAADVCLKERRRAARLFCGAPLFRHEILRQNKNN